jgi:hypothetical protein
MKTSPVATHKCTPFDCTNHKDNTTALPYLYIKPYNLRFHWQCLVSLLTRTTRSGIYSQIMLSFHTVVLITYASFILCHLERSLTLMRPG